MAKVENSASKVERLKTASIIVLSILFLFSFIALPLLAIWYFQGSKAAFNALAFFGVLGGIGVIIGGFGLIVEEAVKSKGKALKIANFINGVSILFLCLVGFYVVIEGANQLWNASRQVSVVSLGAIVFIFYYWAKRKDAENDQKKK